MDLDSFLDIERLGPGECRFHLPTELHGAFGGAFGGMIGACAVSAARDVATGRVPNALDCRFLRGLPAGRARSVATVLRDGRSLTNVSVDLFDEQERLATRATVSFVEPGSLKPVRRDAATRPAGLVAFDEAPPWPAVAPIVATLGARSLGSGDWGFATAVRVPWDADAGRSAEAACLAGDICVGAPLGAATAGENVSPPNPDLSLRFCGTVATPHVVGIGRTERAHGGVAAVGIEVWSGDELVAIGVSTALLLPMG